MNELLKDWPTWFWPAVAVVSAAMAGILVYAIAAFVAKRVARRTGSITDDALVRHLRKPAKWILPLLGVFIVLPSLPVAAKVLEPIRHVLVLAIISFFAWMIIALTHVVDEVVTARYRIDTADNLAARRVQTQFHVLRRVVVIGVGVVTVSVMLMTFPSIRHLGVSLFASAGVAGLVLGIAMRPTLANLIAGAQIALTQPVRIDDVVIVEGEWGWIEEINTTYVVVRIWDLRRMVLPLSYFIEQPFQNWTRTTAELLGAVFIYADYTVPVDKVRDELRRILDETDLWDRKTWGLQVTNASEHTVELRALMSARDSGTAWNLRCYVREKLLAYLQESHPGCLPKTRAQVDVDGWTGTPAETTAEAMPDRGPVTGH